jgi:hypothetical protein
MKQAAVSEGKDRPVDVINRLLQGTKPDQGEAVLAKAVDRLTREEKDAEAAIEEGMGHLAAALPLVWNDIELLQEVFEVLDSQATDVALSDHVSTESLSLIKQIEEIDVAKKKLGFLEDCLERNE